MINISDNFGYQGPKANFDRDFYSTTALMKAVADGTIDDGHIAYCSATKLHYEYHSSNSVDTTLGKWREYKPVDAELSATSTNAVQNKVVKDLYDKFTELKSDVESIVIDDELKDDSTNAVQNQTIKKELDSIGTQISTLTNDLKNYVLVSNVEATLSTTSSNPVQNKVIAGEINSINTALTNLKTRVDKVEPVDTALSATSTKPVENKAIYAKFQEMDSRLAQAETDIFGLKSFSSFTYCVSDWTKGDLKATANDQYGDPDLLREWNFYLVDHSNLSEDGKAIVPTAKLRKNNLLRTEDGKFAKTIFTNLLCKGLYDEEGDTGGYVTKSVFSNDANKLWVDSKCTGTEDWTAKSFVEEGGIEKFYTEHGKDAHLYYKSDKGVIYDLRDIPRPWEEYQQDGKGFDKLQSVVLSYPKTVYLLDQLEGRSGKIWKGVFFEPAIWDGIDVSKYPLEPTGIGPTPATSVTIGGVQKMFTRFVEYYDPTTLTMSANCQGHLGEGNLSKCFMSEDVQIDGKAYKRFIYGRSYDVSQLTNCTYARNNNPDTEKPYPFAEGGYHSRNVFVSSQETLYKTKYLNATNFFASGISANDAVSNQTQWESYGGIRWRKKVSGQERDWRYGTWNTTPAYATYGDDSIYYNNKGKDVADGETVPCTHFNSLLSWWFPKEQVLESQTAASLATEYGVEPGQEYEFCGKTWWYKDVPGAPGLQDGEMNCIIYKKIPYTLSAYDYNGVQTDFEIEVILRMSLMNGYNHSGDYWIYYGGGYEQVGTVVVEENGSTGNPVEIYTCFDQTKWIDRTTLNGEVSKNDLGTFSFESDPNYVKVWEGLNLADGYTAERPPYTAYKSKAGGSLSTGECFYAYTSKHWSTTLNQRIRVGFTNRDRAENTRVSHRVARICGYGDLDKQTGFGTYMDLGGSDQVRLSLV